jgi:hypothetical protein
VAQNHFSIEIGPSQIFNLSYRGTAKDLHDARGINIGLNYKLNEKTLLNLQFGYQKFHIEQQTWVFGPKAAVLSDILYPVIYGESIPFYNISLAFRAYFNEKGMRPYLNFGGGIHFIKGNMFLSGGVAPTDDMIPGNQQTEYLTKFYLLFGPGLSVPISKQIDIMVNSYISVSGEVEYIFLPVNLLLKYNL